MPYFIDTNIFLRVLIKGDQKQFTECKKFLSLIKQNVINAITSTVVLAEIAWTLASFYKIPRLKIARRIRSLINLRGLKIIDDYNHPLALNLFERYSIKYIDALIASNKDIYNKKTTIISYDRDFDKLPILWKEPKEVLAASTTTQSIS